MTDYQRARKRCDYEIYGDGGAFYTAQDGPDAEQYIGEGAGGKYWEKPFLYIKAGEGGREVNQGGRVDGDIHGYF